MKTHTDSDAIALVNATDLKMRELYRNNRHVTPDTTFAGLVLYSEDLVLQKRFGIPAGTTNSVVLCLPKPRVVALIEELFPGRNPSAEHFEVYVVMSTRLFVFRKTWTEWLARAGVSR